MQCMFLYSILYIVFLMQKELSKNKSRLSAVTLTNLVMKLRRQIKGKTFDILGNAQPINMFLTL